MSKKFVVSSLPRTGSTAVMKSLAAALDDDTSVGNKICKSEPFWLAQRHEMNLITNLHDHVGLAKKLFEEYDGFKIIINQTMQLREICDENNAGLILIRRNDYLATLASLIIMLTIGPELASARAFKAGLLSPKSYETWTSTRKKMVYNPNDKTLAYLNYQINQIFYANHLIDNVFPTYSNYVTTINYENQTPGLEALEEYFGVEIPLILAPSRPISDYFVNHEEFKKDVEDRIKNEINGVQHD